VPSRASDSDGSIVHKLRKAAEETALKYPRRLLQLLTILPLAVVGAFAVPARPGLTVDTEANRAAPDETRPSAGDEVLKLAPDESRPNVLLIVTDDQRVVGTLDVMPKTRSWFEQGGTRFSNAFATTPLCCPGRASLFSGRYAHNHGVRTNGGFPVVQQLDQRSTLQRYLQEAGYRTALIGKFFYSWNLSVPPPFVDDWALFRGGYNNAFFNVNGTGHRPPYSTDFIAERAVHFLGEREGKDQQPWFLYIGTQAPHLMPQPEPDYAQAPVPPWEGNPSVFEFDRTDKPPWVRAYNPPYGDTFNEVLALRQQQLRTLMSVDDLVGTVFEKLVSLEEDRDTLAIFISDNGFIWGEHALGAEKRFPYTPSVQIPFFIRWPGQMPAGATDPRLAANVDVLPTVLQATGLSPDPDFPIDGRSLLAPSARDRLLLEYWRSPDGGPPGWASIRTPSYQYIEWYADDGVTLTSQEYYDLLSDPWQWQNLLADGDPANDPNVAALSAQLAVDRGCKSSCRVQRATGTEVLDADDVRGKLDLLQLAYRRLEPGGPLEVTVATRGAWRPRTLRLGVPNRLSLQVDLNGDARPEYRVRIVKTGGRLRAWLLGREGRFRTLPVGRPNAGTVTFVVPTGAANPGPVGVRIRARSVFFRPRSTCSPACVDHAPDQGYAAEV
jgi:arylsulfatase A-like enzyme